MEDYDGKFPSDIAAIIARRPDLAPFDIHYVMNAPDYPEKKRPRLLTTIKPVGVTSPLSAQVIAGLADDHLIGAIGGHGLEHYKLKYRCEDRVAYLDLHPYADGKKMITFHQDQLWRDLIIWPSEFTDEEANT